MSIFKRNERKEKFIEKMENESKPDSIMIKSDVSYVIFDIDDSDGKNTLTGTFNSLRNVVSFVYRFLPNEKTTKNPIITMFEFDLVNPVFIKAKGSKVEYQKMDGGDKLIFTVNDIVTAMSMCDKIIDFLSLIRPNESKQKIIYEHSLNDEKLGQLTFGKMEV